VDKADGGNGSFATRLPNPPLGTLSPSAVRRSRFHPGFGLVVLPGRHGNKGPNFC
jgi:hypothetical protein